MLLVTKGIIKKRRVYVDSPFANVVLLCHFDGTNGSTAFTDQTGKVLTANGNVQVSTAQSKWGGASGLFDGNNDYISTPNISALNFNSTNNFTLEGWVYKNTTATTKAICGNISGTANAGYAFLINSDEKLRFQSDGADPDILSNLAVPLNQWAYVAMSKSGNNYTFSVNGTTQTINNTRSWSSSGSSIFSIGYSSRAGFPYWYSGYIDDFRILNISRDVSIVPPYAFPNS